MATAQPGPAPAKRPWFKKKRFLIPGGLLAAVVAISVLNPPQDDNKASTARPTSTAAAATAKAPASTPSATPEPEATPDQAQAAQSGNFDEAFGTFPAVAKSGRGDGVVPLPSGLKAAMVKATHKGSSNFSIQALDKANQQVGLLVNEIGNYSGVTTVGLEGLGTEDPSKLKVSADGPWTVTLSPISSAPVWGKTVNGKGDGVFRYELPAADWKLTHAGTSNFSVKTFGGDMPDLLVNEIGKYSGVVPVQEGPQVVVVQADGAWTAAQQ